MLAWVMPAKMDATRGAAHVTENFLFGAWDSAPNAASWSRIALQSFDMSATPVDSRFSWSGSVPCTVVVVQAVAYQSLRSMEVWFSCWLHSSSSPGEAYKKKNTLPSTRRAAIHGAMFPWPHYSPWSQELRQGPGTSVLHLLFCTTVLLYELCLLSNDYYPS